MQLFSLNISHRSLLIDRSRRFATLSLLLTHPHMELTQEYFDQQLKNLATKEDVRREVQAGVEQMARIISETVAEPMEKHFAEHTEQLNVRGEVEELKRDVQQIKAALHLSS